MERGAVIEIGSRRGSPDQCKAECMVGIPTMYFQVLQFIRAYTNTSFCELECTVRPIQDTGAYRSIRSYNWFELRCVCIWDYVKPDPRRLLQWVWTWLHWKNKEVVAKFEWNMRSGRQLKLNMTDSRGITTLCYAWKGGTVISNKRLSLYYELRGEWRINIANRLQGFFNTRFSLDSCFLLLFFTSSTKFL